MRYFAWVRDERGPFAFEADVIDFQTVEGHLTFFREKTCLGLVPLKELLAIVESGTPEGKTS